MALVHASEEEGKHKAFARYYLRALSGAADRTIDKEAQYTRLMLSNTGMTDADIDALCTALCQSWEANGSRNCSLSLLEEIDISHNPSLTANGIAKIFDTMRQLSMVANDGSELVQSNGDACNALWRVNAAQSTFTCNRRLATSVVLFSRISRALFDVTLPLANVSERDALEERENADRAARRTEQVLKRIISPDDLEVLPDTHPLDDREHFWTEDVALNAKLNKFPLRLKQRVLASMIRHSTDTLSLMMASTMDLSDPPTEDDLLRVHPKVYSAESAAFLADILGATKLVTMLDLSNNNKGDAATVALAPFLSRNKSVVDLRLRSNHIGTVGGLALAEAVKENTTLVELDLADNTCSDVVATAFRELIVLNTTRVGFVNWDRNCVTPSLVTEANYQLMLNTQPRLVKDTVNRLTRRDPQLSRVIWNVSDLAVNDNTLKVLMQSVRGNEFVTHIDISNSKVTSEGARYLAEIISNCPSLRTIVAQFNYITDEGALILLHALPDSKSMEKLDLKFQQPRPISTKVLQSIEQVSNLGNQPYEIRKKGLSIVVNDPTCTEIDLSVHDGETKVTDETVKTLASLMGTNTNVTSLNLSNNRFRVTGKSIPLVVSIAQHLLFLDLSGLYLGDMDVIQPLGEFLARKPTPVLRELNLADNQLTRAASYELAIIARNDNDVIQRINFEGNAAITHQDRDVVEFYCGVNNYTKAFKNIILDIEANEKPQLTEVNFTVVERTSAQGTSHRFSKEFDDHSARLICVALAQNNTVHKVIFSGNRCTDIGATYWAQLLRVNVAIHHLDVSYNQIGTEGLTEIAESLEFNHNVKVFGFEGNPGAKDVLLGKRILGAVRKSATESADSRTVSYTTAHSVSNTHHAKALKLSLAQAAAVDAMIEDAIMSEAMADYAAAKAKDHHARQQQLLASQLQKNKDASTILQPLVTHSYKDSLGSVPSYLLNAASPSDDNAPEAK